MVYTITLNPALDYVMYVDKLRFDDINRATKEAIFYGGKGINVSVILTRLGIDNAAMGFVGGFTGRKLEDMLKADNIVCDFDYLETGNTRINVKVKAGDELDINANGPDISSTDIDHLLKKIDRIREGDYLVLAGSIPKNLPEDIYERILQKLEGRGVHCIVDATGDLLLNVLKYRPFLIKPNHHELGDLFGVETDTTEKIVTYARKLQEMGARNVLISWAEKGAVLVDEEGQVHTIGNAPGTLVNSVGCGDSMVAGFVAGYLEKHDYGYALRLGTACGNATAFSPELATKEEIEAALAMNV
ncbi:MAG: 1-phosphofructokinase [Lachnospiraceae bacterium]|nr:1-phosphofructokinase [Lachnospiraceae bacterium]